VSETTPEAPPAALDQLATALAAFQAEMPTVAKAHTATVKSDKGSYSYTYAGLADVSEAAMPLLSKHGLSFVTLPGQGFLTGILLHSSGQSLTASLPITGGNAQAIGSSLTYMRRYLLGCMTGLVTDDDDDGRQASAAPKAARKPAQRLPATPKDDPFYTKQPTETGELMSAKTRGRMFALFTEKLPDADEDEQRRGISTIIGRTIESRGELTEAEAHLVCQRLAARPTPQPKTGAES